jgi:mono/diheme cytochrome c family protein
LVALIGALTVLSFARDQDAELEKRQHQAEQRASRARALAAKNGVPTTGAQDVFTTVPMYRARTLFAQRCAGCHEDGSKDRKGPIIGPGHGSRAWLLGFLKDPSGPAYWGKTKLAQTDDAMNPVELPESDLVDVVELLYAQTGATDIDIAKHDRGKALFDKVCNDCHSLEEGVAGGAGPGLAGVGSRDWFTSFISNPKAAVHMGPDKSEMPRFDKDLSIIDRDALAEYLMWLRTATKQHLDALGPL